MRSKPSILIIDNDENLRQTLALILQQAGYTVVTSCLATGMNKLVSGWLGDLIILDINQSDPKGTTLVSEIHRIAPAARIILLTGNLLSNGFLAEQDKEVFGYLVKPIDPSIILDVVAGLLSRGKSPPSGSGEGPLDPATQN